MMLAAPETLAQGSTLDYDSDDDNLIEVISLEQLNAIHWDLDGDGASSDDGYAAAFPDALPGMGCPGTCAGYELTADLNFDTNNDGDITNADDYWNGGEGWLPIGDADNSFSAHFNGNGHTISNLFINRTHDNVGLFGNLGSSGSISGLRVVDVNVTGGSDVGVLLGLSEGTITACYAAGRVSGNNQVGGLTGRNKGTIFASYAAVAVSGDGSKVGGLVGQSTRIATITVSYATGTVRGDSNVGGLTGLNGGTMKASYATGPVRGDSNVGGLVGNNTGTATITAGYFDTVTSGLTDAVGTGETSGAAGKTTGELQSRTHHTHIYCCTWNEKTLDLDNADGDDNVTTGRDNPWHLGEADEYPALRGDFGDDDRATWQEFGYQLREGPALAHKINNGQVTLTWTAPTTSHWSPPPAITYAVYRDGAEVQANATSPYTDTGVTSGESYQYQVAAVVNGGEASRSALLSVEVTNEAPAITSQTRFYIEENQTAVGAVTTEDRDDSITGYALGGADASLFSIALSGEDGVLTFKIAPDFEAPGSAAGTNEYTITVTATGGTGGRAMDSDSQTVTITVTGANDPSTWSGDFAGAVTEDAADNTAPGSLFITDSDDDDNPTIEAQTHSGTYGSLAVLSGGAWTYTLDNANSDTNAPRGAPVAVEAVGVRPTGGRPSILRR